MGEVGSEKLCPVISIADGCEHHCKEKCEWNDGEGCAVWRIVKALERGNYWLELLVKHRGDSK